MTEETTRRDFLKTAAGASALLGAAHIAGAIDLAPPDKQPADLKIPGPPGKKVGFAIVGLGELALGQVLPAFALCEHAHPVALVSGHPDKAKKVAFHYGIDEQNIYSYANYDSLKDNPSIDVIYIILPNSMHCEYTVRGFAAGKHVLCEKPMATSSAECIQMIEASKSANKKLMIAYRLQYEPYNMAMIEMARKREHGEVHFIEAQNLQDVAAPNIRLSKSLGGGSVWDVGVYCINAARYITGEEPDEVTAFSYSNPNDPRFAEVDETTSAILRFPSGAMANCTGGFSSAESRRYRVNCSKGWFELEKAFGYEGQSLHVNPSDKSQSGAAGGNFSKTEKLTIKPVNHFSTEMDYFCQCLLDNKPVKTPGEEGLADLRVIEAVLESAKSGRPVRLPNPKST